MAEESYEPGVYTEDAQGRLQLVHAYQDGDYGLEDIVEMLGLGRMTEGKQPNWVAVTLTEKEMRELKVMADAYSFDYDQEFIEMCLVLHRFSTTHPDREFIFSANF